ncbi:MAG: histidine kinase N-terminal 7TM domain-containing protein [Chloroflexota bacterium]
MTRIEALYLLPYVASLALSLGVLYYTWTKRSAKGATAFTWYVAGQTLWLFGFIVELISPDIFEKIFWDGFQWLAGLIIIVAFPIFAVQYTEYKFKDPRRAFIFSLIVPGIFIITLMTDAWHHLIYANPRLTSAQPFPELLYDFTWLIYGYALYSYIVTLWGVGLLVRRIIRIHDLYRTQGAIIIVGFLIPILGTVITLFNIHLAPQRDITPFTNAIANMIIAWGLFRYKLFEVVPVGRDRLFEAMVDPVVILDNQHIVVDINTAMLSLLDKKAVEVIGQPAKQVFDNFPIPIKRFTHVSYARDETTFEVGGKNVYYEMTVWPLYDSDKKMTGRIYISHDITALKELERELRELNVDLEKRVRLRTMELAEAYDVTLEGWAKALELRDKETEGHSRRVTETTVAVARAMGIHEDEVDHIRRGAILHDIGKMGVPDHILRKEGALTVEEREIILKHPGTAYELLRQIPFLEKALEIPYSHHEKWDGTGYPRGLKEREIPLPARIFAIVDVWDALSFDRPYRKAWKKDEIIQYLINESGKHFDPRVLNIFLALVEKGEI